MQRKTLCLLTVFALAFGPALGAQPPAFDKDVLQGIRQVEDGDYDGAILTLDNAARRLAADPTKARELSQAYLYLGVAYMGKGHEAAARAKFREAVKQFKDLSLSPEKFPPKIIDAFEAAKDEAAKAAAPAPAAKPAAAPVKKGGSKKGLVIGGVVLAGAGVGVAAAAGGGGGSKTPSTPTETRKTDSFGPFTYTSENYFQQYSVFVAGPGTMEATLTWDNPNGRLAVELKDPDGDRLIVTSVATSATEARFTTTDIHALANGLAKEYKLFTTFASDGSFFGITTTGTLRVIHP